MDENICCDRFFYGLKIRNLDLISSITCSPDIHAMWLDNKRHKNRIWFYANGNDNVEARKEFGFDEDLERPLKFIPFLKGSDFARCVTMTALVAAQRMGLRYHILVGCDFDTDGERHHARHMAVNHKHTHQTRESHLLQVKNVMRLHRERIHKRQDRLVMPVYNCTPGSALRWNNMLLSYAAEKFGFMKGYPSGRK
jgi:hypothetical protein